MSRPHSWRDIINIVILKSSRIHVNNFSILDVPSLPSIPGADNQKEEEEEEEEDSPDKPTKARRPSGPKVKDPYAADDTSTILLPVIIAVGAFIPLVFCLCKL